MGCLKEKGAQFHILHQGMCWNTGYCPGICREQRPCTGHILLLNCEKVHKSILYPFIIISTFRHGEMAFCQRCSELPSDTFESCVPVSSAWTRVTFASDGWEAAKSGEEICNIWNLGWTRKWWTRDQCKKKEQEEEDSECVLDLQCWWVFFYLFSSPGKQLYLKVDVSTIPLYLL